MTKYQLYNRNSNEELLKQLEEYKLENKEAKGFLDTHSYMEPQYKRIVAEEKKAKSITALDELKVKALQIYLNKYLLDITDKRRAEMKNVSLKDFAYIYKLTLTEEEEKEARILFEQLWEYNDTASFLPKKEVDKISHIREDLAKAEETIAEIGIDQTISCELMEKYKYYNSKFNTSTKRIDFIKRLLDIRKIKAFDYNSYIVPEDYNIAKQEHCQYKFAAEFLDDVSKKEKLSNNFFNMGYIANSCDDELTEKLYQLAKNAKDKTWHTLNYKKELKEILHYYDRLNGEGEHFDLDEIEKEYYEYLNANYDKSLLDKYLFIKTFLRDEVWTYKEHYENLRDKIEEVYHFI